MPIKIDHTQAEEVILEAYRSRCGKNDSITGRIKVILHGTHKTYKYILVNGILAKAVSEQVNPISLQAGAPFAGAFDARSLCHKVLVPFERDFLSNVLGGSNEPFLNKPARFTHLSEDNAVRKGEDHKTLLLTIDLLSSIKSSSDAKAYLACVFSILRTQIEAKQNELDEISHFNPTLIELYEFSVRFMKSSFEGETAVIIVGTIESLLHTQLKGNFQVISHKINQSGASSKETGDIDIFHGNRLYCSIEVKDKNFNAHDVAHAFNKVLQAGGKKAVFVHGTHTSFDKEEVAKKLIEFEEKGLFVVLQDVVSHIKNTLLRIPACSKEDFTESLLQTIHTVNPKEEVLVWMRQLFVELGWQKS